MKRSNFCRMAATCIFAILFTTLAACSNPDEPIIDENLLGVVWKVDSLHTPNGDIVTSMDSLTFTVHSNDTTYTLINRKLSWKETFITIQFTKDMEIILDVCNTGYADYKISQRGTLAIDGIGWTEMACPSWLALEGFLTNSLKNVTAYMLAESRLTLSDKDHLYIVYLSIE